MKLAWPESQNCVDLKWGKRVSTSGGTETEGGSLVEDAGSCGAAEGDWIATFCDDGEGALGGAGSEDCDAGWVGCCAEAGIAIVRKMAIRQGRARKRRPVLPREHKTNDAGS
jgi:hypothetical protein